jgi:glycolate oxidase iron-sulfur subunit
METHLADFIRDTPDGIEADAILRKCVHCGFCTATCPTYQLLGDELDGPRGRIYLIKQVLEGSAPTASVQMHLDRCLTCRNCETTCPSGVRYGRLVSIGREVVDAQKNLKRPLRRRLVRFVLREILTRRALFDPALALGRTVRPVLPKVVKDKVPLHRSAGALPLRTHGRRVILLEGCVQPALVPNINAATARVLDRLGIGVVSVPRVGCCGAVRHHLEDKAGALREMKNNIDAWIPLLDAGCEAIVSNASACALEIKEYGAMLASDPVYADRAARVSAMTRDLSEIVDVASSRMEAVIPKDIGRIAFHPPCTLQHGQKIQGVVENLLRSIGIEVSLCSDSHLCCGSAGTYSILEPELATPLRDNKLHALHATGAQTIVSANIGCLLHLQSGTSTPVRHWIEILDSVLNGPSANLGAQA